MKYLQIRDVFDSWRSDWVPTSVPRESEKKCLESSNNKERLPLLESTKYLLLLFNREKIFTSPQKTSHFIIQSSIECQSENIHVFCPVFMVYFRLKFLVSIDSISRNRYTHELLWACGFRDVNVRDFDGVIFSLSWVAITVVYLNLSQVSVLSTPNNM